MITKEDFINAEKIVNDYKIQLNKTLIRSRICVCCRTKEIKPLEGLFDGQIKVTAQEQGCWNDGTVEKITFGYGSRHDMRSFYIAICDDCVELFEKDGLIIDIETLRNEENTYMNNQ